MKTITLEELKPLLAAHPDLPLLDVRTPKEYEEAHAPRAYNEPLRRLPAYRRETKMRPGELRFRIAAVLLTFLGASIAFLIHGESIGFPKPLGIGLILVGVAAWLSAIPRREN